ncbi:MAG TPA: GPR1/FUN34/YaaH family transporter [Actinomycetota bacterium]
MQETREAPVRVPQPLVVQVAPEGDPQILGLPVFVLGSMALGLNLLDYVSAGGSVVPIIFAATGVGLLVATGWAARLGQTFVAGVFGIFAAFWLSYSALLLGLFHNWYAIPAEDVAGTIRLFLLSWASLIFFLTVASLRLPLAYPLVIGLVDAALIIVFFAWVGDAPPNTDLLKVAGVVVMAFASLGAFAFLSVASVSLGGRGYPLGPTLVK